MTRLFSHVQLQTFARVFVRYRRGPDHWLEVKRKRKPQDRALEHFDDFYGNVYGDKWESIRTALLEENHKYMAVVNNYSDSEKTLSFLTEQGAVSLKSVYQAFDDSLKEHESRKSSQKKKKSTKLRNEELKNVISDAQRAKIESLYPDEYKRKLGTSEADSEKAGSDIQEAIESAQLRPMESELNNVDSDDSRIVKPSLNVSGLYEYIPATKIKGVNDWVLESDYYKHYTKGSEFSVETVDETSISFPKYLHAYTFEADNDTRFPMPNMGSTNLLNYYLFDGASILPVLALDLQPGEVVLDMCAAPGGKSLAIMQTLTPSVLVVNDVQESRIHRIARVFDQFTKGFEDTHTKLVISQEDARHIEDKNIYDKILVDVPCTTDRHSLHSDENNLFKPSRVKERLKIPEVQTEILLNAFRIVKIGGTVVYSTCSLSPIQNEGVVQLAMKRAWEEENIRLVVKNMSRALKPLKHFFDFGNIDLKHGHIAIPSRKNNWGPMYFCKITRVT